jgi:hypothetical protein
MALGSRASNVLRLVLGQGACLTLIGVAIGLLASYASSKVLAHYL